MLTPSIVSASFPGLNPQSGTNLRISPPTVSNRPARHAELIGITRISRQRPIRRAHVQFSGGSRIRYHGPNCVPVRRYRRHPAQRTAARFAVYVVKLTCTVSSLFLDSFVVHSGRFGLSGFPWVLFGCFTSEWAFLWDSPWNLIYTHGGRYPALVSCGEHLGYERVERHTRLGAISRTRTQPDTPIAAT